MGITFIRKLDGLGRVVLPKDVRKLLKINLQDYVEIGVKDENIIISKLKREVNDEKEV